MVKIRPARIKPSTAISMMRPYCGTEALTIQEIAQQMKRGKIRTYARYWTSYDTDIVAARRRQPPSTSKKGQIDHRYFTKAVDFAQLASSWNWDKSLFWCTMRSRPIPETKIYKGVRFSEADVLQLVREARKAEREKKKRGGAPGNVSQWHRVWLAILKVLMAPGFEWQKNPYIETLRGRVHDELGGPYPAADELANLTKAQREDRLKHCCPFQDQTVDEALALVMENFSPRKATAGPKT